MLKSHQFENDHSLSLEANNDAGDVLESVLKIGSVDDKSFNEVHWRIAIDHAIDEDKTASLVKMHDMLTGDMKDTLKKIVSEGPVEDSSVPSKKGRDKLKDLGMVEHIAVKGEFGQWAATGTGFYLWDAVKDDNSSEDDDE